VSAFDVAVVGGGPAGSMADCRLAAAGARVLLVDKATFPRDKRCGGGVTLRAARLLPFSLEPVVEDRIERLECRLGYGPRGRPPRARAPAASRSHLATGGRLGLALCHTTSVRRLR